MTLRKSKSNMEAETVDGPPFACGHCRKSFQGKPYLLRHIRRNHRGTQFQCYYCDYSTKFKGCLGRHVKLHLLNREVRRDKGTYVKCPLCDYGSKARETMLKHYVDDHDVDMRQQIFEFPSMEDFHKWKNEIERTDVCQFASCSKKNRDAVQTRYYRCFRDGVFHKKGKGIRMMKLKGSVKINGICPAGMRVEEHRTTGAVKVSFVRSHVGHSNELGLLNLSKDERAEIARKLAMGMTYDDILVGIRGSLNDCVKRLHLTTRKDVYNIQSSYGIPTKKEKREKRGHTTKKVHPDNKIILEQRMLEEIEERKEMEEIAGSGVSAVEANIGNDHNVLVPDKSRTTLQLKRELTNIVASETHVWGIQYWTESQEPDSFYSAQNVPEKIIQNDDFVNDKIVPDVQHGQAVAEPCDSSNDNDGHYFEVVTPDPLDNTVVRLESQLNGKKARVGALVEEILDAIKTEEQADMFYNELLRIRETVLAHSSMAGQF